MLAAMVDVASEHGFADATVTRVVARAGVSRRTFYEIFEDREECFLAALDQAIAHASRYVLDTHDPRAKWAERIRTALIALLSFLEAEHGLGELLIIGSLGAGHRALERRRRCIAQITAVIDEGRNESETRPAPPPLTAEGIVGGALSIIHARLPTRSSTTVESPDVRVLQSAGRNSLLGLVNPLMSMIVLPYLGPGAARRELARPVPETHIGNGVSHRSPLHELGMRLTYRTVRVLLAVAACPGSSNRTLADAAGISDQGQISKLLVRLQGLGLIENAGAGSTPGGPNAWMLTPKGRDIHVAINTGGEVNGR